MHGSILIQDFRAYGREEGSAEGSAQYGVLELEQDEESIL